MVPTVTVRFAVRTFLEKGITNITSSICKYIEYVRFDFVRIVHLISEERNIFPHLSSTYILKHLISYKHPLTASEAFLPPGNISDDCTRCPITIDIEPIFDENSKDTVGWQ